MRILFHNLVKKTLVFAVFSAVVVSFPTSAHAMEYGIPDLSAGSVQSVQFGIPGVVSPIDDALRPTGLQVVSVTADTITVQWSAGVRTIFIDGEIIQSPMEYAVDVVRNSTDETVMSMNTKTNTVTLTGLQENRQYTIGVTSILGDRFSEQTTVSTYTMPVLRKKRLRTRTVVSSQHRDVLTNTAVGDRTAAAGTGTGGSGKFETTLRWKKPAGDAVAEYRVRILRRKDQKVMRTVRVSSPTATVRLKKGKYVAEVTAVQEGDVTSAPIRKRFRVKRKQTVSAAGRVQ